MIEGEVSILSGTLLCAFPCTTALYVGDAYFKGSSAEPLSCIIGAFHANYHTTPGNYAHEMGIVEGGNMAILAGAGPMGLWTIDYAIHCDKKPKLLVVRI